MKVKDDQREAQRVVVFDRMSKALKQAGSDYSLPLPEALRSQYIDRTCITIFNSSDQVVLVSRAEIIVLQFALNFIRKERILKSLQSSFSKKSVKRS